MAKDFRVKAHELDLELLSPITIPEQYLRPAVYPADDSLPVEVKGPLQWLSYVCFQLFDYWGWLGENVDEEEQVVERLVYEISEADLGRLKDCLRRLDEAIGRHPGPSATHSIGTVQYPEDLPEMSADNPTWSPGYHTPDPDDSYERCKVSSVDGKKYYFSPSSTTRWVLESICDDFPGSMIATALCRTRKGKWIMGESRYGVNGLSTGFDSFAFSFYTEITKSDAIDWFINRWMKANPEGRDRIPTEIYEEIKKLDIDEAVEQPRSHYSTRSAFPGPRPQPSVVPVPFEQSETAIATKADSSGRSEEADTPTQPVTIPGPSNVEPVPVQLSTPAKEASPSWNEAYRRLIEEKQRSGARTQRALLAYMADKTRASTEDIAFQVHDDTEATDEAIRKNVSRVNEALALKAIPISFTVGSGFVFKDESTS